jgi:hypothetical protein
MLGLRSWRREKLLRFLLPALLMGNALGGCASGGAPSFVIFGAYFPAWLLCAFIGVVGAILTRAVIVTVGLETILPYLLFVCVSAGVITGGLAWLLWFGW